MKLIKSISCLLATTAVMAGNLSGPISLPAAKTLPKGVRNVSLLGVMVEGNDKYSSNGEIVSLADPFYQPLSFSKIVAGQDDPTKAAEVETAFDKVMADGADSIGDVSGQVNLTANATVAVFAYGVSNKVTAAIAVPVIKTSLNVSTAVNQKNTALYNSLKQNLNMAPGKKEEFIQKLSAPVNEKLSEYGYKELVDEDETKLGDIKLVSKYKAFGNAKNAVVLTAEFTLPTGREEDINKAVDLPGGDGQLDTGLFANYDFYYNSWLTFSAQAGHTVQWSDTAEKRVPFTNESKLTPYIDKSVERDLGDISMAAMAAKINYEGVNFGVGYSHQYKDGDSYSGSVYKKEWYDLIGKETTQRMESVTLNAGYDTISLFKKKKFAAPLSLTGTFSKPISGKNVVKDSVTTVEFKLFF